MTDDLVERLREGFATNLEYEAADRIEVLDKRNKELEFILMCALADFKSSGNTGEDMFFNWIDDAIAALGEKKDG